MKAAMSLVGSQGIISVTEILIALAVFCLTFMVIRSFRQQIPKGLKRLSGPRGYPLIGNVLELGSNPHLTLTQMSQKYGDVMQIQIGTRPVLVLSGLDTIKQALVKQGEDFMGRPDLYSFHNVGDGQSLAFSTDSGEVWRARRKLAQNALKTFSVSPSPNSSSICLLEEHVSKEADYLVRKFLQLMEEKKRFDPYRYVVVSVANVICAMCFGKRYDHDDQELLSIVNVTDQFGDVAASGNTADFIPVLQYLPNSTMKKFIEFNKRFLRLLQDIVKEHYESFEKDNIRDITDSLIEQSQENKVEANANIQLPKEKIVNLVNDLFGAGFDTVTTALSWSLMYLVTYPDIQKKIQEELDQTIGRERRPRLSDRPMLPYTEAFILEMFRHSSFMPFTIPHCTTKDTVLNGYYIPKDLCVFVNQWQVNHDEKLWKEPSKFDPERFLHAGGTEVNKADGEKVLVFGLGKRKCIGETIARWEVFLFLTTLLQQLEFSISDGEKVDITPKYGLTMKHKRCEHFQIKQRFPIQSSE
ncbi:cytochrome P450 1A5-like [Terrapene carolina triunguis]|uniref:cytochrome P450 1A5-like n=1 Tax=Terrapene triunguis TaxID=2587831 RepID=UPI000CF0009F|nr:cytochrome P450 1A5-like [Terrapene carolina triunguis]XP_024066088.1 cytochrome P450 1A5-like [Terrapene carolina triunguis]